MMDKWISFYHNSKFDSIRAVSISMEADRSRTLYDVGFTWSENKMNDCTPFIEFFLEIMSGAYNTALETQRRSTEIVRGADERL